MAKKTVGWDELQDAAESMLCIFVDPSGSTGWAQKAWAHLAAAGLTSYSTRLERARVLSRFIAVCWFYWDFVYFAFEIDQEEIPWNEWAGELGLTALIIGSLRGTADDVPVGDGAEEDGPGDEEAELATAIMMAAMEERPMVVQVLKRAFMSTSGLFMELWVTGKSKAEWVEEARERLEDELPSYADASSVEIDVEVYLRRVKAEAVNDTHGDDFGLRMRALEWLENAETEHHYDDGTSGASGEIDRPWDQEPPPLQGAPANPVTNPVADAPLFTSSGRTGAVRADFSTTSPGPAVKIDGVVCRSAPAGNGGLIVEVWVAGRGWVPAGEGDSPEMTFGDLLMGRPVDEPEPPPANAPINPG